MTRYRFEFCLAAAFSMLVAAVWIWQNPGFISGPLKTDEIERYTQNLENLPLPVEERAEFVATFRNWMETDDGQPVYVLNLMRYYPELRHFPGSPAIDITPQQSNSHYEQVVMPSLFKVGGYPAYAGSVDSKNLLGRGAGLDDWSRVLLVRYPSRRAFMNLVADPGYALIAPYKLMALKTMLTPTKVEMLVPPPSLILGGLLMVLFLAVGWWRAARRSDT